MSEATLAIVTGAAHRLGRSFALALARRGHAVLVHFHSGEQDAQRTADEIRSLGVPAFIKHANLREAAQIEDLFKFADTLPHPLQVIVNSAAVMTRSDARSLTVQAWDDAFDLNLRAAFLCAQQAATRMSGGGLIVNVTDVAAQQAWHVYPAYTVSKAALESLTKVLARAYAPGIRVNAIAPGLVLQSEIVSSEQWEKLIRRLPLKRAADTGEIAAALDFLVANEYVTGQTIVVDGGYSLI
jgi:pteridine reductase